MVEKLAHDYAAYFTNSAINDEKVDMILAGIEQMLNRLDEFESIMNAGTHDDSADVLQNIAAIAQRRSEFQQMCQQIDSLDAFVAIAEQTLNTVEQSVDRADEELGVNSLGLKGLLLRGKKWATGSSVGGANTPASSSSAGSVSSGPKTFEAPPAFVTSDYFVCDD